MGQIDTLECPASVDSGTNLEAGMVTTEAVGELPSSKSSGKCCISSADTLASTATINEGITLLADNMTEDAAHQLPNNNAHESEHTAFAELENTNVVGDHYVSKMAPDATVGEEFQIRSSRSVVISKQRENDEESGLEEGEIPLSEPAGACGKTVETDILASKLPCSSTPPIPQEVFSRVELPVEEDEFASSDDHNSICEGCDVGGELMYVTTPSLTSTPSSSLV